MFQYTYWLYLNNQISLGSKQSEEVSLFNNDAEREAPPSHHEVEAARLKISAKAPTDKPWTEELPNKATSTCELLYHALSQ